MKEEGLTPNEIMVLSALYELGESDVYQVLDRVKDKKKWQYKNVENLLSALYAKGFVHRRKVSHRFRYKPKFKLGEVMACVLNKLFGNTIHLGFTPFVDCLFHLEKLSPKDVKILRSILDIIEEDNFKEERVRIYDPDDDPDLTK